MTSVSSVSFDGITLLSDGSSRWKLQSIIGWYDGPSPRINLIDRPTNDGYFNPGQVFRSGRAITVVGFVTSPDSTSSYASDWLDISGIASAGTSITLTVVDPAGTMTATVWLAAAPTIRQITDTRVQFQIQFVAPDPLKYGPAVPFSTTLPTQGGGLEYNLGTGATGVLNYGANGFLGRISLVNSGNAAAYPMLRVTGGLAGGFFLNVLETGDVLSYPRVMGTGDTIYLNNRTGRALINNQSDVTSYLDSQDFFSVPAGATRTVQFNKYSTSSGTPTLAGSFSPANW